MRVMPSFASLARQNAATGSAVSDYGITSRAILSRISPNMKLPGAWAGAGGGTGRNADHQEILGSGVSPDQEDSEPAAPAFAEIGRASCRKLAAAPSPPL